MEQKFWHGIWMMPKWNGIFQEWNGGQSSILDFVHCMYNKYIYGCQVVINNIVTKVLNFNINAY